MVQAGVYEAKTKLSSLIDRALTGETVLITRHNKPVATLNAYNADKDKNAKETRPSRVGFMAKQFEEAGIEIPDDFDVPDEEIIKMFDGYYGEPLPGEVRD
jgi:prevent-host-death family protein